MLRRFRRVRTNYSWATASAGALVWRPETMHAKATQWCNELRRARDDNGVGVSAEATAFELSLLPEREQQR
jgi:hypothetical protein